MSGEVVVQQAVLNALWADPVLASLLPDHAYSGVSPPKPAVYEFLEEAPAPEDASKFPYVVVGDTTAAEYDDDLVDGQEHTLTIHVWDRYPGKLRARQVVDAIYNALHRAQLQVSGRHLVLCYWEFTGSVPDPDMLNQHMVARIRVVTQEV